MMALYLACLGFGFTVLAASLALGGKGDGQDHGHAAGSEGAPEGAPEGGGDGHELKGDLRLGDAWNPFASVRFWTFGLFSFGLVGSLLTAAGLGWIPTLVCALGSGGLFGSIAASFFQMLHRDSVSGETQVGQLAGEEGRVLVPIRPGGTGKIVVERMSGRVELPATTRDPIAIEAGQRVLVASVSDGVADVSRVDPAARGAEARRAESAERTSG